MAHMQCICGNSMSDGDGHVVYDVFSKKELKCLIDYIKNDKRKVEDVFDYPLFYENDKSFWLCDECKEVHMWSYRPEYCERRYTLRKNIDETPIEVIKTLDEYFVINQIDYDNLDKIQIMNFLENNPMRPYKYYVTKDLTKVYIINTDVNKLDRIYDLTYESFIELSVESVSFDNLHIRTIDKVNNGHEYIVEDGVRKQRDIDDYPHRSVHFMITKQYSNGGTLSYEDPDSEPEIYTINTMDEFNKKYSKYYSEIEKKRERDKENEDKIVYGSNKHKRISKLINWIKIQIKK